MKSRYKRRKDAERIKKLAGTPSGAGGFYTKCSVPGCQKQALHATAEGVAHLCQHHLDFQRRHGHHTHRTFSASQLSPYRWAAILYIEANAADTYISNALLRIRSRLSHAGPVIEAHETRGLSPAKRANAILSRIRRREIAAEVLLAIALGVEATLAEEGNNAHLSREFARVQYAKVLQRLAGGYVRKWKHEGSDIVHSFRAHAQSNGRMLRHLGKALEGCAELVVQHHLQAVLEAKRAVVAKGRETPKTRPYPQRYGNKHAENQKPPKITTGRPQPQAKEVRRVTTPNGDTLIITTQVGSNDATNTEASATVA